MLLAIVADVEATLFICVNPQLLVLWQMLLPHCKADEFAIVADGITTFVWADVLPNCANWNSYIVTAFNWFNLWQME